MLLAILTVGAVSASDDVISDDLTVSDETGDEISQVDEIEEIATADDVQEDIVGDGEKTDLDFIHPKLDDEVMLKNSDNTVGLFYLEGSNTTGPVTGNVSISIDGKIYYNNLSTSGNYYSLGQVKLDELYENGNLTFGSHNLVLKFFGDELYNDYTLEKQFNYTFYIVDPVKSSVYMTDDPYLGIYFVENATGNLTVFLDGKQVYNTSFDKGKKWMYVYFEDVEIGKHDYTINYTGNYPSIFKSYSFVVSYIKFHIQDGYAGNLVQIYAMLPSDATQNLTVTYKGKEYELELVENWGYMMAVWTTDDYTLGENAVTFSYQDDKYPPLEVTETFTINPVIHVNGAYRYNSTEAAQFALPRDATGKFAIYLNNKTNKIGEVQLTDGRGTFLFEGIPVGKYSLFVTYDGDDYEVKDYYISNFRIDPNVIIPKAVNVNESYNITIIVNSDIKGSFDIQDTDGYSNHTTVDGVPSGILTIPLNLTIGDHTIFVKFFMAGSSERFSEANGQMSVKNVSRNWEPILEVPKDVNLSNYFEADYANINITNIIDDGTGMFTLIINDDEPMRMSIHEYSYYGGIPLLLSQLNEGINNWTLSYIGDDYYNGWQFNGTINASGQLKSNLEADIPQNLELS